MAHLSVWTPSLLQLWPALPSHVFANRVLKKDIAEGLCDWKQPAENKI